MQLVISLKESQALTALGTFALPHQSCLLWLGFLWCTRLTRSPAHLTRSCHSALGCRVCSGGPAAWGPPTPLGTAGRPPLAAAAPTILKREPGSATQGRVLSWSRLVREGGHPSPAVHCDLRPRNFRKHTLFKCPAVPWKSAAYTHVSLP